MIYLTSWPELNSEINLNELLAYINNINEHSNYLEKEGKHVYRFGFGQSPFPVPEKVVDSLQANAFRKNYLSVEGLPELRQAIASYHQKFDNIDIESEQVLIGPGSKELMFSLQLALKGITILPAPCWVSYSPHAKILNREIIFSITLFPSKPLTLIVIGLIFESWECCIPLESVIKFTSKSPFLRREA